VEPGNHLLNIGEEAVHSSSVSHVTKLVSTCNKTAMTTLIFSQKYVNRGQEKNMMGVISSGIDDIISLPGNITSSIGSALGSASDAFVGGINRSNPFVQNGTTKAGQKQQQRKAKGLSIDEFVAKPKTAAMEGAVLSAATMRDKVVVMNALLAEGFTEAVAEAAVAVWPSNGQRNSIQSNSIQCNSIHDAIALAKSIEGSLQDTLDVFDVDVTSPTGGARAQRGTNGGSAGSLRSGGGEGEAVAAAIRASLDQEDVERAREAREDIEENAAVAAAIRASAVLAKTREEEKEGRERAESNMSTASQKAMAAYYEIDESEDGTATSSAGGGIEEVKSELERYKSLCAKLQLRVEDLEAENAKLLTKVAGSVVANGMAGAEGRRGVGVLNGKGNSSEATSEDEDAEDSEEETASC
jgi:hypothetical protein